MVLRVFGWSVTRDRRRRAYAKLGEIRQSTRQVALEILEVLIVKRRLWGVSISLSRPVGRTTLRSSNLA